MNLTILQLITCAMQDIGAIAKSEMPSNDEAQDAITTANMMVDAWSVRSLMVLGAVMEQFTLTAGQQSYTMGIGGDFNTSKPSKITDAFVRNSEGEDTGVDILLLEEWNAIDIKAIDTGPVVAIYYDPGLTQQTTQTGTINTYPTPDAADTYTLWLGEQKPLAEFGALTDTVTFQPAYYEALRYNLAKRLWGPYHDDGKPIPNWLAELASESERVVMNMNAKQVTCTVELPGRRGNYGNILDFSYPWSR